MSTPSLSSKQSDTSSGNTSPSIGGRSQQLPPRKQTLQRYNQLVVEQLQQQQQQQASPTILTNQQQYELQSSSSQPSSPLVSSVPSIKRYPVNKPSPLSPEFAVRSASQTTLTQQQQQHSNATAERLQQILNRPAEMSWHPVQVQGKLKLKRLRSHSATLIDGEHGTKLYVFGGYGDRECYSDLCVLDLDTLHWSRYWVGGDAPPSARRSHSATAIGPYIYVFGGGDGPIYTNDLYLFDTRSRLWLRLVNSGDVPPARRAHSTCYSPYHGGIFVFGGGDGRSAMNDLYFLRVVQPNTTTTTTTTNNNNNNNNNNNTGKSQGGGAAAEHTASYITPIWERWETTGQIPPGRGYHSMHLIDNRLIVIGGGDGTECFGGIHSLDLDTLCWSILGPKTSGGPKVLGHSGVMVGDSGSQIFIIGGDNGSEYNSDVWLLNLESPTLWERCHLTGVCRMPPRAYHTCVWHDSRLFILGGYNGDQAFADLWTIHLAGRALIEHQRAFHWTPSNLISVGGVSTGNSAKSINNNNNNNNNSFQRKQHQHQHSYNAISPSLTYTVGSENDVASIKQNRKEEFEQPWLSADPMIQQLLAGGSLTDANYSNNSVSPRSNNSASAVSPTIATTMQQKSGSLLSLGSIRKVNNNNNNNSSKNRPRRISAEDPSQTIFYLSNDTSDLQLVALASERLSSSQDQSLNAD